MSYADSSEVRAAKGRIIAGKPCLKDLEEPTVKSAICELQLTISLESPRKKVFGPREASDYGLADSRFETWRGRVLFWTSVLSIFALLLEVDVFFLGPNNGQSPLGECSNERKKNTKRRQNVRRRSHLAFWTISFLRTTCPY